jgi:hypothetical protein
MEEVWKHPTWTAIEVGWRWIYGALALGVLYHVAMQVLATATGGRDSASSLGIDNLTVTAPFDMAQRLANAGSLLLPVVEHALLLWGPLLLAGWVVASTLGRVFLLRRVEPELRPRISTLIALGLLRIAALAAICIAWFASLDWAGRIAVTDPIAAGAEPRLVFYCGLIVGSTLVLFVLWGLLSWIFALAPLLSILENRGVLASLRGTMQRRPRSRALISKLVEINLVMGIVKVSLLVLAMVFSACPLPFESIATGAFLLNWNIAVGLVYLVFSDLFHVVRLVSPLRLWQAYHPEAQISATP